MCAHLIETACVKICYPPCHVLLAAAGHIVVHQPTSPLGVCIGRDWQWGEKHSQGSTYGAHDQRVHKHVHAMHSECANNPRPVVSLTSTRPGTDVVAMTAAALAAASVAIKEESSQVQEPVCTHCVHNKDTCTCELSSGLVSFVAAQGMDVIEGVVGCRACGDGARTVVVK